MLSPEGCAARRQRLWSALPAECDLLLVADPTHLIYLANYEASPFEFRSNESGALLILAPDRSTLVGDNLLGPYLDRAFVDAVEAPVWYDGRRSAPPRRDLLVRSALGALAAFPGGRVGVELGAVPAGIVEGLRSARKGLEIVDLGPVIRPLRRAKDDDELTQIRRSIAVAEAALAAARAGVEAGMTEFDVFRLVVAAADAAAGEAVRVYGDFVSGPRCEQVGGPPTGRVIARGDLFLLDFSVVVGGYRGDFASTWAVGAGASAQQQDMAAACLEALTVGESHLRPGASARDLDAAVRAAFASRGLAGNFRTHSGHGVGLGHPEPPYLVPESDDTLVAGDVVAVEPGQYLPGVAGMRFERDYLVTDDSFEVLSRHPLGL